MNEPKILFLDIETAPNLATVWSLWEQNIGVNQLTGSSYILCWAAKWKGGKKVMFDSVPLSGKQGVVRHAWNLLNEADIIVHYNGRRFDMPTLRREFLLLKLNPPAPYKQVDLYVEVKKNFMFVSNKMDYIASRLGIPKKKPTTHQLWLDCMFGKGEVKAKAWKTMKEYNMHDVEITECIYGKLLGWLQEHPNMGLWGEPGMKCPNCGSSHLERGGWRKTKTLVYKRYKCVVCGSWCRDKKADKSMARDVKVHVSAD